MKTPLPFENSVKKLTWYYLHASKRGRLRSRPNFGRPKVQIATYFSLASFVSRSFTLEGVQTRSLLVKQKRYKNMSAEFYCGFLLFNKSDGTW